MVVVVVPVPLDVLGEEPQGRGDRGEGDVELRDLVELEKADLLGLGSGGEVSSSFAFAAAVISAALHELAAEQEVGLSDRGDVLWGRYRILFWKVFFFFF